MTDRMSADHVARAIVAASRETGADPLAVATGAMDRKTGDAGGYEISRARAYAGAALFDRFPAYRRPSVARMVGVRDISHQAFAALVAGYRRGGVKWWDNGVAGRVLDAVGVDDDPPVADVSPLLSSVVRAIDRPTQRLSADVGARPPQVSGNGKRDLADMLAEAARNTAKMNIPKED